MDDVADPAFWARLRECERRSEVLGRDIYRLQQDVRALQNGMWQFWTQSSSGGICPTFLKVAVQGTSCRQATPGNFDTFSLAGTTVQVSDHATGLVLATNTLAADTTNWIVEVALQAASGSPVSLDFALTPPSVRFVTPAVANDIVTACGNPAGVGLNKFAAATGYHCQPLASLPLATTMKLDDTAHGITGLTISGSSGTWSGSSGIYSYQFRDDRPGTVSLVYFVSGTPTSCPDSTITSLTQPADPSTKFSVTYPITGGAITIHEP